MRDQQTDSAGADGVPAAQRTRNSSVKLLALPREHGLPSDQAHVNVSRR